MSKKRLTPLYKGLRESHPVRLLQPLLDVGADPTILTKNGRNAFHYAAKSENAGELLVMLIQHLESIQDLTNSGRLQLLS